MPAPSDLVHETTSSTGTGNLTLANVNGKRSFNTAFGTGGTDLFDYFISNRDAAEWERGTGHLSAASTFVRDTVLASSNAGAAVNFSAGTKDVTNDIPAAAQIYIPADPGADRIVFWDDSAGSWQYLDLSGLAISGTTLSPNLTVANLPVGSVLQCLQDTYTSNANLTVLIPDDDTVPTSTEGTQILSQAITPTDNTNKILCEVSLWGDHNVSVDASGSASAALFRGTTCIQVARAGNEGRERSISFSFLDSPATTSATTYTVRVGPNDGGDIIRLNGTTSARLFGGASSCTLTVMEIAAA